MSGFLKAFTVLFFYIFLLNGSLSGAGDKDKICRFTVYTGDFDRDNALVSILLDEITCIHDTSLVLYEIEGDKRIKTGFQTRMNGNKRYLNWILSGNSAKGTSRQYELVIEKSGGMEGDHPLSINYRDGGYEFISEGKTVLKYNSQVVMPPEGTEAAYKRSGFINPLYAPNQEILTRIPDSDSDHLHHYGLWNAWKKVLFRGEEIDFFAPQFGQGLVSIQFMSHPGNYNHPEPMRIWPSEMNEGKGNIYVNFNPVRNCNWLLSTGKSYLLKYRLCIINGELSSEKAERAWNEYSNPVKVKHEFY